MDGIIDKHRWIKTAFLIAAVVGTFVAVIFITSCIEVPTVVSCDPIDVKYTKAYDAVETEYEYKLNMWTLEYQLVPVIQTVHHEETWSVLYQTTWSGGNQTTEWRTCTEEEYDRVKALLDNT